MFGLSSLYVKLIGGAIAALMLLGLILGLKHYKALAESRGETLTTICQATRDASGQPKLKCGQVPAQIGFMGQTITAFSKALDVQSARVAALGAETERQQSEAVRASRNAATRARAPEATSARLEASSRAGERQAKPCDASPALKGAWQ